MKIFLITLLLLSLYLPHTLKIYANESSPPYGYIDTFDKTTIAGWAKDSDAIDNPVILHIFVDGMFYDFITANNYRSDVGQHAFQYTHKPFGPGVHKVDLYIIGIDQFGNPDGTNARLLADEIATSTCNDFTDTDFMLEWCQGNTRYWNNKYKDTTYLTNDNIKIGINNSYGGTILELYGKDRTTNLIQEHGGSAVQLSLYGYDTSQGNEGGWFATKKCSMAYPTKESCEQAEEIACVQRGAKNGSHVANCTTVNVCNGEDAGFPYNPIQAQGINCSWNTSTNDVNTSFFSDNNQTWNLTYNNFSNFSKTSLFPDLNLTQKTKLHDNYAEINYIIKYNGLLNLDAHGQEIPAIFSSNDINYWFYYIDSLGNPQKEHINPGSEKQVPLNNQWKNRYWGVCNQAETHCLSVYMPSSIPYQIYFKSLKTKDGGNYGGAYLTPTASFAIQPNLEKNITLYMIPEKFQDAVSIIQNSINPTIENIFYDFNSDGVVDNKDANFLTQTLLNDTNTTRDLVDLIKLISILNKN